MVGGQRQVEHLVEEDNEAWEDNISMMTKNGERPPKKGGSRRRRERKGITNLDNGYLIAGLDDQLRSRCIIRWKS